MPSKELIDIINQYPGEFVHALKASSYLLDHDNDNVYQFRKSKIQSLTAAEKKKNEEFKEQDQKLAQSTPKKGKKDPTKHIKNTIKVSLNNNERLNTPLEKKSDDPSIYSNVSDADTIANVMRAMWLIGNKSGAHHGSRIKLINDQNDPDFDNHDYLVFEHGQSLFRIQIGENEKHINRDRGQYHINKILRKYLKCLSKVETFTEEERKHLLEQINKDAISAEEIVAYKKFLNDFLLRQDISFGWATKNKILKIYPHEYARKALLAKRARNAQSKILILLGAAMIFAPFASTLLSLYITQRSGRYVFVEAAQAEHRSTHNGYNPEGKQLKAIESESWKFSLATMPSSALSFISIAKDMSILQISAFGQKSPDLDLEDYIFNPLERFISDCTAPFISGLTPLEARLVLTVLSGLLMASFITVVSCAVRVYDKVNNIENAHHVRKPLWEEFAYGFIAGVICYSGSLVGRSEKYSVARVIEEMIYAATTLALAFSLYKAKPVSKRADSATMNMIQPSKSPVKQAFTNTGALPLRLSNHVTV